ncbi:hypothetical protein [Comamonas sp. B-9]|uniref:hypothetical protein n=1 Tax=Comamonas sp. B-9 TaxID=1055192 RepID=UPI0004299D9C|nr:hypothetical protein [Comamonas sp. B-9]
MTSEVLVLNKSAIVLGADSAVTTSSSNPTNGDHPRYSKTANKIFELCNSGAVAVTIYSNAAIDLVPWELVIKLFRADLGKKTFAKLEQYGFALMEFIKGNNNLFPKNLRDSWIEGQFDVSLRLVLDAIDKGVANPELDLDVRKELWRTGIESTKAFVAKRGLFGGLSQEALDESLLGLDAWVVKVQGQLALLPILDFVDPVELAILVLNVRYSYADLIFPHTGVVVAGYGNEQIFPAYSEFLVYGHIGDELAYISTDNYEVTHSNAAMIKPLAQSSMIDMFTNGFSKSLENIIEAEARDSIGSLFAELKAIGVELPDDVAGKISQSGLEKFMSAWKDANWKQNFHPLLGVLQSLSVSEMAHLVESLLSLQSLKERVTSSSETVGGPIDVAAITKSEGLIWIKRKHFFDPSLNIRYASRLDRSYE